MLDVARKIGIIEFVLLGRMREAEFGEEGKLRNPE